MEDLKSYSVEELKENISAAEKALDNLTFSHKISPIENPLRIRTERRALATMKMELHSRTLQVVNEKVSAGELTSFNARAFLAETKLPTPMTLVKLKKIIGAAN